MSDSQRGQVSASAAEVYDQFFVPALFSQWTDAVLDVADVRVGHRVLDVGCGTGVLARAARSQAGADGDVAGVDPNEGMLAVARRAERHITWGPGVAEHLGFPHHSFDRTVSQFALMFFSDPAAALVEMSRVPRPHGRIAIAVWTGLENNVGYALLSGLIEDLFGSDAAEALRAPFALGDPSRLAQSAPSSTRRGRVPRAAWRITSSCPRSSSTPPMGRRMRRARPGRGGSPPGPIQVSSRMRRMISRTPPSPIPGVRYEPPP